MKDFQAKQMSKGGKGNPLGVIHLLLNMEMAGMHRLIMQDFWDWHARKATRRL